MWPVTIGWRGLIKVRIIVFRKYICTMRIGYGKELGGAITLLNRPPWLFLFCFVSNRVFKLRKRELKLPFLESLLIYRKFGYILRGVFHFHFKA